MKEKETFLPSYLRQKIHLFSISPLCKQKNKQSRHNEFGEQDGRTVEHDVLARMLLSLL